MAITKTHIISTLLTLSVLWAVHNVKALAPIKNQLNFDQ